MYSSNFLKIRVLTSVVTLSTLLVISSCAPHTSATAELPQVDPLRWTEKIQEFKQADAEQMPDSGAVLFVGSSSIVMWKTLAQDFPEISVINRGFGGSHMSDLNHFFDEIVLPYAPGKILVYEGDNDIAYGKSPETVLHDFKTFVSNVKAKLGETPIYFISIKPSISREAVIGEMMEANGLIWAECQLDDQLYFIDIFKPMLNDDNTIRSDIFIEDMLHLNAEGYKIWTKVVRDALAL